MLETLRLIAKMSILNGQFIDSKNEKVLTY